MTDLHLKDSTALAQLPPHFDVATWNIGRSGELAPGVEVWTTWLPVQGYYETLVINSNRERYPELFGEWVTRTRPDAYAKHAEIVQWVQAVVAEREVA